MSASLKALKKIEILDTTLRDGSQQEGLSLTVDDKLKVAEQLDILGVTYIEGGWPGAHPKDNEFFKRALKELNFKNSKLVAFGATRKAGAKTETDQNIKNLLNSGCEYVCMVAKAWDLHVKYALLTTLDEAKKMVYDSVKFLTDKDIKVFLDAEHFFDGYKANKNFALSILKAAQDAGALRLVLCDTNGGSLPDEISATVGQVNKTFKTLGIHCHNDTGCAVANSIAAVKSGAIQVQGCINGYGERTGNADLSVLIPNLSLKLGYETIPEKNIYLLTPVANHIAELINTAVSPQKPYVGSAAFAHKAGLHTSANARKAGAYEHIDPTLVGNTARYLVSEMSGKATLKLKAKELNLKLDEQALNVLVDELKKREYAGYHYEAADGSFELLMRRVLGWQPNYFTVESFRVETIWRPSENAELNLMHSDVLTEATVKLFINNERVIVTREGNGPVNALDNALRAAIEPYYPKLKRVHLTDYKVRVLDSDKATAAVTRVLIDTSDGEKTWSTIGVSENIIDASWEALLDSINFALLHLQEAS
jgi:2-isopropylmalate synthase